MPNAFIPETVCFLCLALHMFLFTLMLVAGYVPASFGRSTYNNDPILKSSYSLPEKSLTVDDFCGVSISLQWWECVAYWTCLVISSYRVVINSALMNFSLWVFPSLSNPLFFCTVNFSALVLGVFSLQLSSVTACCVDSAPFVTSHSAHDGKVTSVTYIPEGKRAN